MSALPIIPTLHWPDGTATSPCRLCVTIPAKDESDHIEATLEALRQQTDASGAPLPPDTYEVIVLANNCSDDTAARIRTFAHRHPDFRLHVAEVALPPPLAHVGTARRMMMDAAARRLPATGIICTTDADTRVDRRWVSATLNAFERGALAVGGRILVPSRHRNDDSRRTHLMDVTYRHLQSCLESIIDPEPADPWPRHFQHYGPSIAVRVDAYLACGGMPYRASLEDVAFTDALERIGVTIVHDPAVKVYTSDRCSGRVDGVCFSRQLDTWNDMRHHDHQPAVGSLHHCIQLYKWKVALRRAFRERRIGHSPALFSLVEFLNITAAELEEWISRAVSFGALYQDVRYRVLAKDAYSNTTFERAIADLRQFTRSARLRPLATRRAGSVPPAGPQYGES